MNAHAINLAKDLSGFNMALTADEFELIFNASTPYRIADIPDMNQLVLISEMERIPVIALNNQILTEHRLNTVQYRKKIEDFASQYNLAVQGILKL